MVAVPGEDVGNFVNTSTVSQNSIASAKGATAGKNTLSFPHRSQKTGSSSAARILRGVKG